MTTSVLWTSAADGLAIIDTTGKILAANTAFEGLFGFHPGSATDASIDQLVPEGSRASHADRRAEFHDDPATRRMGASRLLEGRRLDGRLFPVNISLSPLDLEGGPAVLTAIRDLSDRMAVESARADAERRRSIAEDHDRIARELHDTVIQHLFALGLRLQGLPALLSDEHAIRVVNESVDTIDEVIGQVRSSIHGLRTTNGRDVDLRSRVLAVVQDMRDVLPGSPSVRFEGGIDQPVDGAIAADLIAVLRETLSNAGRHAQASTVDVKLRIDEFVSLEVRDDGVGIPSGVFRSGLANLEARAHALGGTVEIAPVTPHGTVIRWQVPSQSS